MGRITDVAPADEAKIVDMVCTMLDIARDRMTTDASWQVLEDFFYEQLVRETVLPSVIIVAWAEAGHPAAHRALWHYATEMGERSRFDDMLVCVRAYVLKTGRDQFMPFPRGRHVVQNLMRDIWLPIIVRLTANSTGLEPTRSATTTTPSAAYFVALGMKRKGIKLKEREINRIYWNRNKVAAALEASMPALIPASTIKENI
jgi:hypothetical protein